jgi:hypothetical protein
MAKKIITINPPPSDHCCERCGKHISKLKPFGGAGDPLVGDFKGALLLKTYREEFPGTVGASWECRDCIILPDKKN